MFVDRELELEFLERKGKERTPARGRRPKKSMKKGEGMMDLEDLEALVR
ncbi:hypothetical protein [Thermococcus thioreducens]|uniref:Uncharacterized protein n=1 Tax=Thermococcus thioreducens TaxID=277988 RepID=A0A1I0N3L0_9EURY|nr:hypothetical protein [Thermococcus thioreducens]SEV95233.1 hypothetical protein SAMN05216170_1069 [Thermococcus thioreducens]